MSIVRCLGKPMLLGGETLPAGAQISILLRCATIRTSGTIPIGSNRNDGCHRRRRECRSRTCRFSTVRASASGGRWPTHFLVVVGAIVRRFDLMSPARPSCRRF
jgi:hypothetical protein